MGAWSTKLEGLRLQVPSGWYELASHLVRPEVRRLAELIVHGSPELDQVIELGCSDGQAGVPYEYQVAQLRLEDHGDEPTAMLLSATLDSGRVDELDLGQPRV